MNGTHKVGFYVGKLEDGQCAAAAVTAPYFCFVGDNEEAVIAQANEALDFYYGHEGRVIERNASISKVVNFVPGRRVETDKEYAYA